jgi:Uma2 family endonuclease
MATVATQTRRYSFEDFLTIVRKDQKADLLNGVIYMASPESTDDNSLGGWLYRLMSEYADELELGSVYFTRVAFRLGSLHGPEPDVAFVLAENLHRVRRGYVDGPPDIAVEIVSPDSADRDYDKKRQRYEKAGVREYWIIDPENRRALFLRRQRGKFREVAPVNDIFESSVLAGFRLDVRWLWLARRPSVSKTVQGMITRRKERA